MDGWSDIVTPWAAHRSLMFKCKLKKISKAQSTYIMVSYDYIYLNYGNKSMVDQSHNKKGKNQTPWEMCI